MDAVRRAQAELGCALDDRALAERLDVQEEEGPARFRDAFALPGAIYLCGNSLGPMPRATPGHVDAVLRKWGEEGVLGWFTGPEAFADADSSVLEDLAAVLGAKVTEVVAMNALTVNLHLLLAAFYHPTAGRTKVVVEEGAFPSDMHALVSHLRVVHPGLDPADAILPLPRRPGEATWRREDVLGFIQRHAPEAALVFLSGVHYATGQLFDVEAIVREARAGGCPAVGFDLAHAVGNVELRLHDWGVDFACFCTYKYLSAGPGAVGGAFVHERHTQGRSPPAEAAVAGAAGAGAADRPPLPRLSGWWGQRREDRFSFAEPSFVPSAGALGFQLSTPSPVMLAALRAPLAMVREAGGMAVLRATSLQLTGYLEALLDEALPGRIQVVTPRDPAQRGCQLSLTFTQPGGGDGGGTPLDAAAVLAALQARGVVADVRKPNVIRVAPYPLYTRFVDLLELVAILKEVLLLPGAEG